MKKGFCFLFIIFCTLLASCTTALADNTELYCTQGQMAYRDGYMYYVTQDYHMTHKLGDGRETGRPETADIWRIADVPGAQPELLGWVPLYDSDGIAQRSVVGMIPCGQWVYFIRASGVESAMKVLLSRLNIATGQVEDLDEMASNASVIRDGDRLYYFSRSLHTPAVLDLAAGDIQPWQLPVSIGAENGYMQQSISGSFSRRSIVDISGGYVYFAAQDKNSQVLQVMRVPLSGGEAETVIADITEYLDCVGFAQGDLFFFTDFQTLWCVDAASQAILDIVALRQDDEDESYRLVRCSIRDGKFYDLKADGLYVSTLGVNRDTLWIPGATEDLGNIGLGKNYIYMFQSCDYDDLTELIRVPLNASSLEEKEIIAPEMGSIDTQEEGNWVFYEYANAVTIDDYRGSETAVQVPSQIHGKPVISVRMSPNNRERPMQSLSIPEGVKRIQYICDDDMTELSLPASLLFLECRGYPYVFGIDDYATIRYAGTKAQWENLCKVSENFVGLDDRHAEHLTVICADGIWAQPDATPAPTEAPFDPNDYSAVWAHHWVRTDDPAAVLDITRNGDGTLHLAARFTPSVSFSLDFLPSDYEIIYFEAPLSAYEGDMRIDGESGMLELALFPDGLDSADPLHDYLVQNGSWFYFTTENPPDLSRYGWVPHEEYDASEDDVYVSPEAVQRLFAFLSENPLTASSGAGAWEGHLRINADGSFTGDYHDADADAIYQVSFSGNIIPSGTEKWGDTVYGLWVENLTTEKTPGTEGVDEYGDRVLYTDAPIHDRDYLRLTLPGTPDDEIPEMVRGEIGGTYWEWDDYSRFVTLSRWDDGWGFFAETEGGIDWPDSDESSMSLVQWGGIWQARSSESRLYIFREEGAPGDYQVIHTMTKNGETRAIRGALYFVDEITVDYDVPGLLYAGIVGDPYGSTLSLTPFSSLDDRMTPWIKVIEGDYVFVQSLDDPSSQIPASVWDLAKIGLDQAAPTAAPVATPPMEGRVLIDDDLWTLSLLGKEQKYGPGYILRMRNNSGRDLSVYVNAQVWFHEPLSIAFQGRDDLSIYETLVGELPAGADITRDLLFSMKDLDIRTTDDLNMTDIRFSLSEGHGGAFREYENVLLDWDPAVTAESLFTPLCTITPQELSGDPSLVSVRALGTYQFVTGRAGILCRVTNNSSMQMNVGGYNVAFGGNFTFAPEVNSQRCSNVIGEMRKSDGSLKRGWLEPGESAHLFFSFTVDGKEVTTISSASILLDLYTPAQEKGKSITLGRYICNLSFTPVAASTATPVPTATPTPSDKLPKHVSRLPNGNLRYDDGLIAFEFPDSFGLTVNGRFTNYDGRVFQSGCTLYKENAAQPIIISYGVEEVPDGESAEEQAWAKKSKSTWGIESYEVVAGHTAKCIYYPPATGSGLESFSYYIPLSGNRLLEMNVFNQSDEELIDARNLFMDTLEIRDSLFAEPPAGPVQTESPAPTPAPTATPVPTAAPDLSAWTGHWMTYAEDMAEMIITNNGNGTLHAKALFLPAGDHEATLTPQGDGSMRFESQYGHLIGSLIRQADGGLRLTFTGGTTMEDEEATEYQGYFAQGFTYYPATYADMWYQTPEDAAATEDDWLGYWTAMNGDGVSALQISRMNGQLMVDVTLGRYHFSGPADTGSDSIMAVYDDDFCCLLLLNNKLNKIAMLEVDTSIEEVYDITGNPYYGVLILQKTPDINTYLTPDQIDALLNAEVPPTLIMPVPTQAPQNIALLPIPGKAGCMQVPISRADATSYIVGSKDPTAYAPFRMIDGEETTSFQFSTKTTPLGQVYLYFDFDGPVTLDELWMKNGFWKITDGKDQYTRNSRVKKMTIFVRFAGSGDYQLLKDVSLKDDSARKDWKVIDMLGVQNVTGVRIRIDEIFKGSKFPTDVCISEIMFVQRAN